MEFPSTVPIIVGDKCFFCTLQEIIVRGGKQVLYIADDGTIIKREPMHRYKEREKRRAARTAPEASRLTETINGGDKNSNESEDRGAEAESNDSKDIISQNEFEAYELCAKLGLSKYAAKIEIASGGLFVRNIAPPDCYLESFESSEYVSSYTNGEISDARSVAIDMYKERAVSLFVLDYLCENDNRHGGNLGVLRNSKTGEYLSMAPYYDFNRAWSGNVLALPKNALPSFSKLISSLAERAISAANDLKYCETIKKRANELLEMT